MSLSSDLHMCVLGLIGEDIHTCTHREEVAGDLTNGGDRLPYPLLFWSPLLSHSLLGTRDSCLAHKKNPQTTLYSEGCTELAQGPLVILSRKATEGLNSLVIITVVGCLLHACLIRNSS